MSMLVSRLVDLRTWHPLRWSEARGFAAACLTRPWVYASFQRLLPVQGNGYASSMCSTQAADQLRLKGSTGSRRSPHELAEDDLRVTDRNADEDEPSERG